MAYYKIVGNKAQVGSKPHGDEWKAYTVGQEPQELIDALAYKTPEELEAEWKADREEQVKNIKVTTIAGNTFDGDEVSQTRMSRAIQGIQGGFNGLTINWKLADNSVVVVDEAELTEALTLAGKAQEALWF